MPILTGTPYKPRIQRVYTKKTFTIDEVISMAESQWPGYVFHKQRKTAVGPCPVVCKTGKDRFVLFEDSGYWCRQCGSTGWVSDQDQFELTKQELIERRLVVLEQQQATFQKKLDAHLLMHQKIKEARQYHENLNHNVNAVDWWLGQGLSAHAIAKWQLGYCPDCPTAPGDSYTIPYYETDPDTGKRELVNIRHRLINPSGGKYRPQMAGLGLSMFDKDVLNKSHNRVLLVEGETKTMVTQERIGPAVGIMGMRGFRPEWASLFQKVNKVVIVLDPDAGGIEEEIGEQIYAHHDDVSVATLPTKIDDAMVQYGASPRDIENLLRLAKKITEKPSTLEF